MSIEQPPAHERPDVHVRDAVVDVLESHIFAGAGDRDLDPAMIPADAAMGADIPDLKAVRIFQGRRGRAGTAL
jgi:hypothetical protein